MIQVRLRLIGQSRREVEAALAHLRTTAGVETQGSLAWVRRGRMGDWLTYATLDLPEAPRDQPEVLHTSLEQLYLPARVFRALSYHLSTVEELLETPEEEMVGFRNLGPKGIQSIRACLKQHGLYIGSALALSDPDMGMTALELSENTQAPRGT